MTTPRSRLDLLVRLRYRNPIPPPAMPPVLVDIPTDISRLAESDIVTQLAASHSLPMMIDSEIGMPIDLLAYDGIWQRNDTSEINPAPTASTSKLLDPEDRILLDPPSRDTATIAKQNAHVAAPTSTSQAKTYVKPDVSWLRNTTYLTREGSGASTGAKKAAGLTASSSNARLEPEIDASIAAQIQTIERSFWYHDQYGYDPARGDASEEEVLSKIKHPIKKNVKAVETFDILPDDETPGLTFNLVTYPERPVGPHGEKLSTVQLAYNLFRPHNVDNRTVGELYVPRADQEDSLREVRSKLLSSAEEERPETFPTASYAYVRDYDVTSQLLATQDFILSFHDGGDPKPELLESVAAPKVVNGEEKDAKEEDDDDLFGEDEDEQPSQQDDEKPVDPVGKKRKREKGIYYTPIVYRLGVKKRRLLKDQASSRIGETPLDGLDIAFEAVSSDHQEQMRLKAKEILDPDWIETTLRRGEHGVEPDTGGDAEADIVQT